MDKILRATAAGGQIRAFAASTRDMVEVARMDHNTSPVATAALGRLLTGGAMMGVMMKGENDVLTIQVRGDGPMQGMTVTANAKGQAKGYVFVPDVMLPPSAKGKLDVGGAIGAGTLQVIEDIGMKEPYVGQVDLQTGEIGDDLTYYFAASEQIPSCVGLGVLMNKNNTVRQAGGFIIQLMPQAEEAVIARLEDNIRDIRPVTTLLDSGMGPKEILEEVLRGMDVEVLDEIPTEFHCDCSRQKVSKALISIGEKDLKEIIDDGKPIEVACHFCNKKYNFDVDELKVLLTAAGGSIRKQQ